MMEPTRIIERGRIFLAGLSFFGDPFAFSDGWSTPSRRRTKTAALSAGIRPIGRATASATSPPSSRWWTSTS
ncbi:MAG: hypothetical protein ACP5JG_16495 [Anaerolineae bacterium]